MRTWIKRHLTAVMIGSLVVINTAGLVNSILTDLDNGSGQWITPTVIIDPTLPRCATEDSVSCVWISRTGPDVIVINGPESR